MSWTTFSYVSSCAALVFFPPQYLYFSHTQFLRENHYFEFLCFYVAYPHRYDVHMSVCVCKWVPSHEWSRALARCFNEEKEITLSFFKLWISSNNEKYVNVKCPAWRENITDRLCFVALCGNVESNPLFIIYNSNRLKSLPFLSRLRWSKARSRVSKTRNWKIIRPQIHTAYRCTHPFSYIELEHFVLFLAPLFTSKDRWSSCLITTKRFLKAYNEF